MKQCVHGTTQHRMRQARLAPRPPVVSARVPRRWDTAERNVALITLPPARPCANVPLELRNQMVAYIQIPAKAHATNRLHIVVREGTSYDGSSGSHRAG